MSIDTQALFKKGRTNLCIKPHWGANLQPGLQVGKFNTFPTVTLLVLDCCIGSLLTTARHLVTMGYSVGRADVRFVCVVVQEQ